MSTTVILVTSYDPSYLAIYEHLARVEVAAGNIALAFDISAALATPVDSYHRGILKVFGLDYPGHDLRERLTSLGAEFLTASGVADPVPALDDRLESELAVAVRSALITFRRTDQPDLRRRIVRRTAAALEHEGRVAYRLVRNLCRTRADIVGAYVPNGRFPHQKLARLAFEDAGVHPRHVEKGQSADLVYVQEYSPHDRFRSQANVDPVLAGRSDREIDAIADSWLARRVPAQDSHNEYSTLWASGLPPELASAHAAGTPIAGFFTSSQDEFLFQGDEWQVHDWADQFDAFDAILTRVEALGYRSYLRVHPNLATRAHDYFVRERDSVRRLARAHPDLIVIWHDDPANSYTLLDASQLVVVFASTIGVEASARGIPVWATAAATYGEVADVHEIFSAEALEADGMTPWAVDPRGAKRYIAFLVERDQKITGDRNRWETWPGRRPLGATVAAVAVSGGTPGVGSAIWSLVDQYRHRGVLANVRLRRRR